MLPLHIDWLPVVFIVSTGALFLAVLRLAVWFAERRARAHTAALLRRALPPHAQDPPPVAISDEPKHR